MMAFTKKCKITSVGEDIEKLEVLCTAGGNVKWYSCCWKQFGGSGKKKIPKHTELPYDSPIPLLAIYSKKLKIETQTDTCTLMFIAASLPIAKRWEQSNVHQQMNG